MPLRLATHQVKIVDWILSHDRCAIWAQMGSGKTVSVLFALSYILLLDPRPALVIAPLRVKLSVWSNEVERWSAFSDMSVSIITGDIKKRQSALSNKASIFITNLENIPWLVKEIDNQWNFSCIVVDESTRLKSFRIRQGSKMPKSLARVAWKTERFIELTGTPSPNSLIDLWGQIWFLDKGERLGRVFQSFVARWFDSQRIGAHVGAVKYTIKPHAQKEIEEKLSDLCLSLNVADYQDIDKPIQILKKIELPSEAQKQYRQFERELCCQLQDETIEAFNSASKTVKCLQMANGAVYLNEERAWFEVHNAKIKALKAIIKQEGDVPILVAYHFNSDLERLLKAFPQGVKLDQNQKTIKDWNKGKIPLLFAHPASCGHGLNLQYGGNILVFFSQRWDLEQHQQIIERIGTTRQKRAGFKRAVFIHYLVAQNTIDELVLQRLQTKASVLELLFFALKQENYDV